MEINKDYLINKSDTFCMLLWVSTNININNTITTCCVSEQTETINVNNVYNLETIMNSEYYKSTRINMLKGYKISACKKCYDNEKNNIVSYRQSCNSWLNKYFDEVVYNTNDDGYLNNIKLRHLDIRTSNICNFKCRDCGPELSSSWTNDANILYNTNNDKTIRKIHNIKFLNDLKENLYDIESIYFAGGEPILNDYVYDVLDTFLDKKLENKVNIAFTSNLSVLQYKDKNIIEYLNKFKMKTLEVSIDDIYERGEYFRKGLNFEKLINNINILKENNIFYRIHLTINIHNIYYLVEIFDYLFKNQIVSNFSSDTLITIFLEYPNFYKITVLPEFFKNIIKNKLLKSINDFNNLYENFNLIEYTRFINSTIIKLYEKDDTDLISLFKDRTNKLDNIRNEKFEDIYSELAFLMYI
jgi:sulfatase maturation enzyme AslB (radical SAM superfamily)